MCQPPGQGCVWGRGGGTYVWCVLFCSCKEANDGLNYFSHISSRVSLSFHLWNLKLSSLWPPLMDGRSKCRGSWNVLQSKQAVICDFDGLAKRWWKTSRRNIPSKFSQGGRIRCCRVFCQDFKLQVHIIQVKIIHPCAKGKYAPEPVVTWAI